MALVKFGGGVTQMSGSVGGDTFARNRYGNYVRARTKPINPQSTQQGVVRSVLAFLAQYWKDTLTTAQRQAWTDYGAAVAMKNRLGESTYMTGFNHFVRSNSYLKRIAGTLVAAGPTILSLPEQDPVFSVAGSEASQEITVTYDDTLVWCDEDNSYLVVYQGTPQNATRNFFDGPWKLCDDIEGDSVTPPTSTGTMAAVYPLVEGQKTWCYARIVLADGRMSEPFRANFVCAA